MTEVKDWRKNPRVSRNALPNVPAQCNHISCPHISPRADSEGDERSYATCQNPRVNKQLTDAKCHKIGNKTLLGTLTIIK